MPDDFLGAQETPPLLTLREAVRVALIRNERMLTSRESIDQARFGRAVAESAFGTRITPNLLGSFGQSDVRNQTYGLGVSKRFATGTEVRMDAGASTFSNQIGNFYAADTTLLVRQPLLRGFRPTFVRRPVDRADRQIASTELQHRLAEQQLAIEVATTYYQLITQREAAAAARVTVRPRWYLAASTG